ncbi:MAG TPA: ice-binding family protein [Candidatus Dormibacteraeota bacterium]|jgi:hypothetical protein|nr:ice-binding family protein [Candidatus Dormibacteraeota bacterium]
MASTAPGLGTATSFAVLAGTTVTNVGNTVVNGDLGVSPGTAVTGFGPGLGTLNGTQRTGTDPAAISAKDDLTTAYGVAAASPCNFDKTGQNLGGQTLTPGTYCQTTAPTLSGTLTLSGNGVYIFQIGSTLVTGPGATVSLTNGAQPCNVYWQVGSSATLDTATTFVGNIMALASISLNDSASIAGRALAQTGQVSFINNQITAPTTCNTTSVSGPTSTPTPGPAVGATPPASTPAPVPASTPPTAFIGPPNAGGGPSQEGGLPWILTMVAGVVVGAGAVALATSARLRRSRPSAGPTPD